MTGLWESAEESLDTTTDRVISLLWQARRRFEVAREATNRAAAALHHTAPPSLESASASVSKKMTMTVPFTSSISLLPPTEVLKDYAANIALEMAHASAAVTASQKIDMDTNTTAFMTYFKDASDFESCLVD